MSLMNNTRRFVVVVVVVVAIPLVLMTDDYFIVFVVVAAARSTIIVSPWSFCVPFRRRYWFEEIADSIRILTACFHFSLKYKYEGLICCNFHNRGYSYIVV
jgi:hypothetical protein